MRDIMFPTMAEGVRRQFFTKTMQGRIMGLFAKGEYGFKSRHSLDFTPQENRQLASSLATGLLSGGKQRTAFVIRTPCRVMSSSASAS